MGAAVTQLMVFPHGQFPIKLFLLLVDPSLAEVFVQEAKCSMDSFAKAFITRFEPDLACPDALQCLRVLGQLWRLDTADIEARHASLRRLLTAAPQAKLLDERLLSALWVGRSLAKRQAASAGRGVKQQPKLKQKLKPCPPKKY